MSETIILPVSTIKDYFFCPRIIFFSFCGSFPFKTTQKMESGKEGHRVIKNLEGRRTLKKYGLAEGDRLFNLKLFSPRLGLSGVLDLLIVSKKEYFPVDFKFFSQKMNLGYKYQLCAYSLLVEEEFNVPVRTGFLYFVTVKKIFALNLSQEIKTYTKILIDRIRRIISEELFPPGSRISSRCQECDFWAYCGGI
ncbi:MAG: CRISPR-associated protein Cas4 [Caldiserica bacterium]|jgi:CRISPR-associated exonuclease Cas4|nr:CRISPR-associated protein Cas4 [Caldisericota bacterium]